MIAANKDNARRPVPQIKPGFATKSRNQRRSKRWVLHVLIHWSVLVLLLVVTEVLGSSEEQIALKRAKRMPDVIFRNDSLIFTLRFGFPYEESPKEPPANTTIDTGICRINDFVTHHLRDQIQDNRIESYPEYINWKYLEREFGNEAQLHLNFTVHATFGNGATISPWTLLYHLQLNKSTIRQFVTNYLWTLDDEIFRGIQTLYFGGILQPIASGAKWKHVLKCPIVQSKQNAASNIFDHSA